MINKLTKMLERLLLVAVILGLICYFAVVCFYKDVFMINTWINGIYCTGKSVEEVNTELLLQTKAPFLTIINRDGETGIIDMAEVAYQEDYTVSLQAQKENQNPWLWPIELGKKKNISLLPQRTWDEGALKLLVTELDIVKKEISDVLMVKIIKGDAGYELYDNLYDVLQPELLAEYVNQCFVLGEMTVQMQLSDAYRDMPASAVQEETRKQWEQLQEYLDCGIVYDMGAEKIAIDHKIASEFVLVDEDGRFILDEHGGFQLDELAVELFIDRFIHNLPISLQEIIWFDVQCLPHFVEAFVVDSLVFFKILHLEGYAGYVGLIRYSFIQLHFISYDFHLCSSHPQTKLFLVTLAHDDLYLLKALRNQCICSHPLMPLHYDKGLIVGCDEEGLRKSATVLYILRCT